MAETRRPDVPCSDEQLSQVETRLTQEAKLHHRMPELLDAVMAISGKLELSVVLRTITDTTFVQVRMFVGRVQSPPVCTPTHAVFDRAVSAPRV